MGESGGGGGEAALVSQEKEEEVDLMFADIEPEDEWEDKVQPVLLGHVLLLNLWLQFHQNSELLYSQEFSHGQEDRGKDKDTFYCQMGQFPD